MEERGKFEELLGRLEDHLRAAGREELLKELDVYRRAVHADERVASHSMDKLLVFCQGWGQDVALVPYVEIARAWTARLGVRTLHR